MAIDPELIDKLLADYKKPEQIVGENGLLKQLTKAVLERALNVELSERPSGAPENVVRTVTENCRTLKFESSGFEEQ